MSPCGLQEGLATWAETKFTEGGRGRNRLLKWETDRRHLDESFCRSLDCLDGPGYYPHGATAYRMGSRFLTFLEENKKGTLSCLVRANARKIPYFLNWSFKECTGKSAALNFEEFRAEMGKALKNPKTLPEGFQQMALPFSGDEIAFGKGFFLDEDGTFIYVSDDSKKALL